MTNYVLVFLFSVALGCVLCLVTTQFIKSFEIKKSHKEERKELLFKLNVENIIRDYNYRIAHTAHTNSDWNEFKQKQAEAMQNMNKGVNL